jgi:hypothetical protein
LILAGFGAKVLGYFAGGDPHILDGATNHVGRRFSPLGPAGTFAITEFIEDSSISFWGLGHVNGAVFDAGKKSYPRSFLVDFNRTCVCKVDVDILLIALY